MQQAAQSAAGPPLLLPDPTTGWVPDFDQFPPDDSALGRTVLRPPPPRLSDAERLTNLVRAALLFASLPATYTADLPPPEYPAEPLVEPEPQS